MVAWSPGYLWFERRQFTVAGHSFELTEMAVYYLLSLSYVYSVNWRENRTEQSMRLAMREKPRCDAMRCVMPALSDKDDSAPSNVIQK